MKSASGNIRKKIVVRNGKQYTYWEARYTAGYDPKTGKQVQRSISAKTQREVRQKLTAAQSQLDQGTYQDPTKITVSQWLTAWEDGFLLKQKEKTITSYRGIIRNHLIPNLGEIRLDRLNNIQIQQFYAGLYKDHSAKTVRNIHGVLHEALDQAIESKLLKHNPSDGCKLTKPKKPKISPLTNAQMAAFFKAIKGDPYESLFTVILLLGLRRSEALGLTWDDISWETGNVTIDKQLAEKTYELVSTKNGEARTITASPTVLATLKREQLKQMEQRLMFGAGWDPEGLVFTNEKCEHLCHPTVYKHFKMIVESIGRPDARIHDLRHSYAVMSLQAGDDIKTVQEHLGHATAAFTLDTYSHVVEDMQKASADRQEEYIRKIKNA